MLGSEERRLYTTASWEHRLGPLNPGSTGLVHCLLGALAWSRIVLNSLFPVPIRATWGALDVNVTGGREMARWVRMFVSQD